MHTMQNMMNKRMDMIEVKIEQSESKMTDRIVDKINKTFDNLVHNKYRMTVDDIGGEVMARHWIEEISKPISITQFEINQDL